MVMKLILEVNLSLFCFLLANRTSVVAVNCNERYDKPNREGPKMLKKDTWKVAIC